MVKVAINGFGRIGRPTFRRLVENHPDVEVVAINDLTDNKTLAHLLKYDSIYGIYNKEIRSTEESISVGEKEFRVFSEPDPEKLPWKELDVDVVLECTGAFKTLEGAEKHIKAGTKKVIISAPSKSGEVPTYILGVNEEKFNPKKDQVIDMGSCTTNCLAPIVKILQDNYGIEKGFMTTIHSYTTSQNILDLPHKDLRRARAAALNIIPTSTGAAKAIGKAVPEVEGKLDGISLRVPTPVVSIIDLVIDLEKSPKDSKEINDLFRKSAVEGIFRVEENPLVSTDFKGDSYSSIVDAEMTQVSGNMVKVLAWYDNEYGFSCRLAEMAEFIGKKI